MILGSVREPLRPRSRRRPRLRSHDDGVWEYCAKLVFTPRPQGW
jgi:hypothetical protein